MTITSKCHHIWQVQVLFLSLSACKVVCDQLSFSFNFNRSTVNEFEALVLQDFIRLFRHLEEEKYKWLQRNATGQVGEIITARNSCRTNSLPGHSTADMKLIPLEPQLTFNASRRRARGAYLIHRAKPLSSDGINRRNER